jgi:hypothetical protein
MTDWIQGPPSAEQVAEHAKEHPLYEGFGLWLLVKEGHPDMTLLTTEVGMVNPIVGYRPKNARYLPLTAEGLPTDYVRLREIVAEYKQIVKNVAAALCPNSPPESREAEFDLDGMGACKIITRIREENAALLRTGEGEMKPMTDREEVTPEMEYQTLKMNATKAGRAELERREKRVKELEVALETARNNFRSIHLTTSHPCQVHNAASVAAIGGMLECAKALAKFQAGGRQA